MKNTIYTLSCALLASCFAFADAQSDFQERINTELNRKSVSFEEIDPRGFPLRDFDYEKNKFPCCRIHFGFDSFFETTQYAKSVSAKQSFIGFRITSDYLEPNSVYTGGDFFIARGSCRYQDLAEGIILETNPFLMNLEERIGYTFQSPLAARSLISPFVGMGWEWNRAQFDESYPSARWFYAASGVKTMHQFCENFDVGLNLKGMYTFAGKARYGFSGSVPIKHIWGYEIGVPLLWKIGKGDFQFQPYLLKMNVKNLSHIVGVRLQTGYDF